MSSFESPENERRLETLIGGVQNTAITLLAPDSVAAETFPTARDCLIAPGRWTGQVASSREALLEMMREVATKYPPRAAPEKPPLLPRLSSFHQGLNIAACDSRPLVVQVSDDFALGQRLREAAFSHDLVGRFHYVTVTGEDWRRRIDGSTKEAAILVVAPSSYGTRGTVIEKIGSDADAGQLHTALLGALRQFEPEFEKPPRGRHVVDGMKWGIRWRVRPPEEKPAAYMRWLGRSQELLEQLGLSEGVESLPPGIGLAELQEAFVDLAEREGLASEDILPMRGIAEQWERGIGERISLASELLERTVTGPEARQRWSAALDSIADETECSAYRGLIIPPQLGLLPIGRDPNSGLWEFVHVLSGDEPDRSPDGDVEMTGGSGLVMVLVPGGAFTMGAQGEDPAGDNYDPHARDEESPVHSVSMSPFFVSKYEMTQRQWLHCTGENPALLPVTTDGAEASAPHPVENVSWEDCRGALRRVGLDFPTEAQWEYACRAGTRTPWSVRAELQRAMNVRDASYVRAGNYEGGARVDPHPPETFDDGFSRTAPIGSLAPNDFGLHDMHGNLWEWCLDEYQSNFYSKSPLMDPVCEPRGTHPRVCRGGNFRYTIAFSRSAFRGAHAPGIRGWLGVRPARAVAP